MRKELLEQSASILMYKGPDKKDIIFQAVMDNNEIDINDEELFTTISVKSTTAYDINLVDIYIYNKEDKLIKQILKINNEEKVIFDKYNEVLNIVDSIKLIDNLAC